MNGCETPTMSAQTIPIPKKTLSVVVVKRKRSATLQSSSSFGSFSFCADVSSPCAGTFHAPLGRDMHNVNVRGGFELAL
jgi:hypothetical protein